MIFHKTLYNIRKKHGYTIEEFAELLGYPAEYIVALECNKEPVTFAFAVKLIEKLNLHDAPITQDARDKLMEKLHTWKLQIDHGLLDEATELKPEVQKGAMSSYSPSTETFYYLHSADYYRLANDMKVYEEIMTLLSQRADAFINAKHKYYYNRLVGARAFVEKRINEAIKAYEAAIALDKNKELHDVRIYLGLAMSLSDSGFASKALEYYKEAKQLAEKSIVYGNKPNSRYDVYIDGYMASDLSKLGRSSEALGMLKNRLGIEKKKGSKVGIGYTHFSFGRVYGKIGDYDKAIKNFDMALGYLDKGSDVYIACVYKKASLLVDNNQIAEAVKVAEIGMSITTDERWTTMLDALKHSVSLEDNPDSATYLKETIIPKLLEFRENETVAYCYKKLSEFYYEHSSPEVAHKYCYLALEMQIKIRKELTERDILL